MSFLSLVKLASAIVVLVLVSSCASNHSASESDAVPAKAPLQEDSKSIPLNAQKGLTVLDAIVAITSGATRPEVGVSMESTEAQIVRDGGLIVERSTDRIVARFSMETSKAVTDYDYCDLEYQFDDAGLKVGPIVIGDCENATIKGTKDN